MGEVYYICGIDTDCGKTYISGLLARNLHVLGKKVITQKLVQTGCTGIAEDILAHRKTMGIDLLPEDINGTTSPYVFSFAASPHLAAEIEQTEINPNSITEKTLALQNNYSIVLVEAAGGLCVPLTKNLLAIDYIAEQNRPIILVSSSKLGSINHTILSIEHCITKGIAIEAIIYNVLPNTDSTIAQSSFEFIAQYVQTNYPTIQVVTNTEIEQNSVSIF